LQWNSGKDALSQVPLRKVSAVKPFQRIEFTESINTLFHWKATESSKRIRWRV